MPNRSSIRERRDSKMRATGKENEPMSPVKSLQTAKAVSRPKTVAKYLPGPQADTDSLCKDFSFMTLKDQNGCNSQPESEPATPKQLSRPSVSAQRDFQTPIPTRAAPKTATKRMPLQNASNNPFKPPASAPPTQFQPPLPGQAQMPAPQSFNTSASPMQYPPPCLPYNSYQMPVMPMYPPYTPHPGHFDPTGRFSAGHSQLANGLPSMYGVWDNETFWMPSSPNGDSSAGVTPGTPQSCYSPYAQNLKWPEEDSWSPYQEGAWSPQNAAYWPQPLAYWPQQVVVWQPQQELAYGQPGTPMQAESGECTPPATAWPNQPDMQLQDTFWSGSAGMADKATTWRRQEPVQQELTHASYELSMRQMTSMCFQASSKGTAAELPRSAVKALVEHQIKNHQPLRAPWYRSQALKSAAQSSKMGDKKNLPGTGVWIPGAAES